MLHVFHLIAGKGFTEKRKSGLTSLECRIVNLDLSFVRFKENRRKSPSILGRRSPEEPSRQATQTILMHPARRAEETGCTSRSHNADRADKKLYGQRIR